MGFAPTGYLTVEAAAEALGQSEWDVLELVSSGAVEAVTLIPREALAKYQKESA